MAERRLEALPFVSEAEIEAVLDWGPQIAAMRAVAEAIERPCTSPSQCPAK